MGLFDFYNRRTVTAEPRHIEVRSADEAITGSATSADITMTSSNDNYVKGGELTLSAVYAAVEMIAGGLSVLPISVRCYDAEALEDGTWLEDALKAGLMTTPRLIKQMITDMLLYGNGFAYIYRDRRGRVTELQYLPAHDVTITWRKEQKKLTYRCGYIQGGKDILPLDMIHILKNTRDGYTGISVLSLACKSINLYNKTENAVADYYNAGLNLSGLIHSKSPMTKQQALQAVKSVESKVDVGKGKFIRFLPFDLEFQKLTESATDAALLETRHFNIAEISRYFSISPALLQDLANSKYNSIEAANIQYLTQTLLPYVLLLESEFNKKLIPKKSKLKIDLDERSLLRTDSKSTAEYFDTLVNAGICTINEARIALGYEPAKGASKLIIPFTDLSQNTLSDLDNPEWTPDFTQTTDSSVPTEEKEPEKEPEKVEDSSVHEEKESEEKVEDSSLPVDSSVPEEKTKKKRSKKDK